MARERGLPERTAGGMLDAAIGLRLRNASYRKTTLVSEGEEISELTATRDLKAIVDAGLFNAVGERRGRYYTATEDLKRGWADIRNQRPPRFDDDPFRLIAIGDKLDREATATE